MKPAFAEGASEIPPALPSCPGSLFLPHRWELPAGRHQQPVQPRAGRTGRLWLEGSAPGTSRPALRFPTAPAGAARQPNPPDEGTISDDPPATKAVHAASSCLANGSTTQAGIGSLSSPARAAPAGYGLRAPHRALHARRSAFQQRLPVPPANLTRPTKEPSPMTLPQPKLSMQPPPASPMEVLHRQVSAACPAPRGPHRQAMA